VVDNQIPVGRGLGSSAAAAAAGALAAWRAEGLEPSLETVFALVAELEDHPDNAAAAIYGGLVLCTPDGTVHRLPLHPDLVAVVAIPDEPLATSQARSVLPESLSRPAVVRSLGRVGALVAGLLTANFDLLRAAGGDELHEAPRNQFRPEVAKLIDVALGAGALHACWSGAGPSVLTLTTEAEVEPVTAALGAAIGEGVVRRFQVAATGLK
jgi:homoserine kinase